MNTNEDITYYLNNYRTKSLSLKPGAPATCGMQRGWSEALRQLRGLNPGVNNAEILAFARKATAAKGDGIKRAKRIEQKLDEHFSGKRELDLQGVQQMMEDASERANAATDLAEMTNDANHIAEMRAWEVVEGKCCDVFREIGISNAEFAIDQAGDYDSQGRAIEAYEQNVLDTTSGCRVAQDIAFEEFHKTINKMTAEGGA